LGQLKIDGSSSVKTFLWKSEQATLVTSPATSFTFLPPKKIKVDFVIGASDVLVCSIQQPNCAISVISSANGWLILLLYAIDDRIQNIMQPDLFLLTMLKGRKLRWGNAAPQGPRSSPGDKCLQEVRSKEGKKNL
jgi:hypothetical protein